jgi:hypothetical protein
MLGKVTYNIYGYALTAMVLLMVVPFSFKAWGLLGAVWVISFSDLPVYFCNLVGLWRENLLMMRQDFKMTAVFVACVAALYFIRVSAGFPWSHSVTLR